MSIFTAVFWKEAWIWLKVNWKKVLRGSLRAREQQLEIERRAAGLETKLKGEATEAFVDEVNRINAEHDSSLIDLAEERRKRENSITSPTDATRELADRFDLENLDED